MTGEPVTPGSENQKPAIDLTQYVSKADHEKELAESRATAEKIKADLNEAKMSLLDPEYVAYLESKAKKLENKPALDTSNVDLNQLSPKQLLDMATQKAVEMVKTESEGRMRRLETQLEQLLAIQELRAVEAKYEDFDQYREQVVKLLEDPRSNLSIEQAYKLAKADNPKAASSDSETPKRKPSGEKPSGSSPSESYQPKDFKNPNDAALDAWDRIVGSGKETL